MLHACMLFLIFTAWLYLQRAPYDACNPRYPLKLLIKSICTWLCTNHCKAHSIIQGMCLCLCTALCFSHRSAYVFIQSCCMLTIDPLVSTQVYVSKEVAAGVGGFGALTSSGTSILVQGLLRETPPGTLQVCCPTPHCCSAACVELAKGTTDTRNNTTRNTFTVRCR